MNCSQLYLGVDKRIDDIRSELFSVTLVPSDSVDAKAIRRVLKRQFIYYLAPHSRCGCGWECLDIGSDYDNLSKQSVQALEAFLHHIESMMQDAKLYSVCTKAVGTSPWRDTRVSSGEFIASIDTLRVAYDSPGANVYVLAPSDMSTRSANAAHHSEA